MVLVPLTEQWLGELSQDLREGNYTPKAVRQVLIPKQQPGQFRPLGIPCIRDRVAQTSAMLVLEPIFEADLQPEQYAYRPERSATDAVKRIHRLLNTGHNEVVDGDLSSPCASGRAIVVAAWPCARLSPHKLVRLVRGGSSLPNRTASS